MAIRKFSEQLSRRLSVQADLLNAPPRISDVRFEGYSGNVTILGGGFTSNTRLFVNPGSLSDGVLTEGTANGLIEASITSVDNGTINASFPDFPLDIESTYYFYVYDPERGFSSRFTGAGNANAIVTFQPNDPYFDKVSLLLEPSRKSFVYDESPNRFNPTIFGDVRPSNLSPYDQNWSNYFDGSDYLSASNNDLFRFRTGDFTVEFWLNCSVPWTGQSNPGIAGQKQNDSSSGWQIYRNTGSSYMFIRISGQSDYSSEAIPATGVWEHWAVTRQSGTLRWFRNGALTNTINNVTADINDTGGSFFVGYTQTWGGYFTGYISNLRVVKGTALYTEAFPVPSAPLTPVANTSVLMCATPRFEDISPSRIALTRSGDTSVTSYGPFAERYRQDPITNSIYFRGADERLEVTYSTSPTISGDFTWETWVYDIGTTTNGTLMGWRTSGGSWQGFIIQRNSGANNLSVTITSGGVTITQTSGTYTKNAWHHVALTRSGSTVTLWVNGVSAGTATYSASISPGTSYWIGVDPQNIISAAYLHGHISNQRFVNGVAVYTGAFTPPTAPLATTQAAGTNIAAISSASSVGVLVAQSSTIIDNSVNGFAVNTLYQGTVSEVNPFGYTTTTVTDTGGSAQFDGSGDYLTVPANGAFAYGTGNFTVEGWVHITNNPPNYLGIIFSQTVSGTNYFLVGIGNNTNASTRYISFIFATSGGGTVVSSNSQIEVGTWNHFAVVRSSGSVRVYLNGVGNAPVSCTQDFNNITYQPTFGKYSHSTNESFPSGYLSNFRIVKGTALYTRNFVPPKSPLTAVANTSLLLPFKGESASNSQMYDSGPRKNRITRVNNASASSVTPHAPKGWTADFLPAGTESFTMPAINPGTVDITLEFRLLWRGFVSGQTTAYIWTCGSKSSYGSVMQLWAYNTAGQERLYFSWGQPGNGGPYNTRYILLPKNEWHHYMWIRQGANSYLYVDGVETAGTLSTGGGWSASSTSMEGTQYFNEAATNFFSAGYFNGQLSNFRLITGQRLVTGNFDVWPYTLDTVKPNHTGANVASTITGTVQELLFSSPNAWEDRSGFRRMFTKSYGSGYLTATPNAPMPNHRITPNSYGVYFDGTGDYLLNNGDANAFAFGTGNFTIEFWVQPLDLGASADKAMIDFRASGNNGAYPYLYIYQSKVRYYFQTADRIVQSDTLTLGKWYHVALTREGSNTKLFINGVQTGSTYSNSDSCTVGALRPVIGSNGGLGANFTGHISNLRLVKGIALYTGNFTVPTGPLSTTQSAAANVTAITNASNVSLLTCQSTTIRDNSANSLPISVFGEAAATRSNPFGESIIDVGLPYDVDRHGASLYLDGSDYVIVNSNTAAEFGIAGPFTFEGWSYYDRADGYDTIFEHGSYTNGILFRPSSDDMLYTNNTNRGSGTADTELQRYRSWHHWALTRDSNNIMRIFVDGVVRSNVGAISGTLNTTFAPLYIGTSGHSTDQGFPGYISDFSFLNNECKYTSGFVIPDAPLTANANTVLLAKFRPGVEEHTTIMPFETVGNVTVTSMSPYTRNHSVYFDGNGDYLSVPASASFLPLVNEDFTFEAWVYMTATPGAQGSQIVGTGEYGTNSDWSIGINSSRIPSLYFNVSPSGFLLTSSTAIQLNTWTHIAVVRQGTSTNNLKMYLNGVAVAQASRNDTLDYNGNNLSIGADENGDEANFTGYISNLRIVKGLAVYTGNFTPPTTSLQTTQSAGANIAAITSVTSVSLLTCQNNRFIDNSTNSFTITRNGGAMITSNGPFTETRPTQGSVYFDGTGDYLVIPASTNLAMGTGDFTVEFWVNQQSSWNPAGGTNYSHWLTLNSYGSGLIIRPTLTGDGIQVFVGGTTYTYTVSLSFNTWYHIALTRASGTMRLFVNGQQIGNNQTVNYDFLNSTTNYIGTAPHNQAEVMQGYIDDVRITKGVARYTENFTPPTSPSPRRKK